MKSKTTIELNGNRYDAVTGAIVGSAAPAHPARTGRNIDGFFRGRATVLPTVKTPPAADTITILAAPAPHHKEHKQPSTDRTINHARAHTPQPTKTAEIRIRNDIQRSQKLTVHRTPVNPNHVKAHDAQHSQTLMRTAVQRPGPSFHKQAGTQGALQHAVPSLIVPKKSAFSLDGTRLARAQDVARSPQIAHHDTGLHAIRPTMSVLAVQPLPTPTAKPQEQVPTTTPAPTPPSTKPAGDNIFEHALASATNFVDLGTHRKHYKKQARRHALSMAAGGLALIVIATFAAYQNSPSLQFKVAGMKAGVATTMPNFKAAGFAYNGVKAGDGKLMVGFSNHSGTYQLVQQSTNLSASDVIQDLRATSASGNPDYRVVKAGSTAIYRFGNADATWVVNGAWYTVNGTGSLTDAQVKALVQHV